MKIAIIGVPLDLGGGHRGVDMGPSAIRIAGLHSRLRGLGHDVADLGDIPCAVPETRQVRDDRLKFVDEIVETCEALAERVERVVRDGAVPIVLGGDHSIAMGTMGGIAKVHGRMGLIYFDAHGDFNTTDSSPSGNIHGMPVAANLGYGDHRLTRIADVCPKAIETSTVLIGLRDLDPAERALIRASRCTHFTLRDIDEHGMAEVMRRSIKAATTGTDRVHLSFDMDVVDPAFAPGTGTPVDGGLTLREAHLAMEMCCDAGLVTSVEVAETNPILDTANRTGQLAVALLASAFGQRIL